MSEVEQYHIQRFGTLKSQRYNWESQWEEAASLVAPAHRDSFLGVNSGGFSGEKKTDKQYDATASFAAQRFASVLESLATPQNSVWHLLKAIDPLLRRNRAVRQFFDDLSETLWNYRYRPLAGFVGNSQQVYLSLGLYGNGVLYVDQPDTGKGVRYRSIHLGEAYFVQNHAGIIDTMYRPFKLTARQLLTQFGDVVPQEVKDAAASATQSEKEFEVLHCVYPRTEYDPVRVDSKGMPFASLYILVDKKITLAESGYRVFPYAVSRYTQAPGETYGRGPAQWVLPAIKVLNEEKRTVLKQGHRIVDPVLLAHDDGNLDSFSMKAGVLNAGGVSKEGRLLIQPMPTGNIAVGDKLMQMEKDVIHDAFLITLFQILIDTPQMTATEVLERAREKGMLLAPTAGRLQAEFLGPLIEREIDVLAAQGLLPQMPPILMQAAAEYRIEYDNPLSRMARAEKALGFMRSLERAAEYAKLTGDPEPLDHFDFDRAMPEILDINGAPVAWTRDPAQIAARREQRAQAAQTQTMIDAAPAVAGLAKVAA